jgi:hypothetical protein
VLVTAIYGTPEAISAYVIFFINRESHRQHRDSVAALVLVSLIIGLVIVLANFSVDDSLRRLAFTAVRSARCCFFTSASKLRPIGAIAMIIGFGLDELDWSRRRSRHARPALRVADGSDPTGVNVKQSGDGTFATPVGGRPARPLPAHGCRQPAGGRRPAMLVPAAPRRRATRRHG